MRIYFSNIDHAKKAASRLAKAFGLQHMLALEAVASACGYSGWHELQRASGAGAPGGVPESGENGFHHSAAKIVLHLAERAGIHDAQVQHLLPALGLVGPRAWSPEDHIRVRFLCWEKERMPPAQRRATGAIVRLTCRPELVNKLGYSTISPSRFAYDLGVVTTRPEADTRVLREQPPRFVPHRLFIPYGEWLEADGARVLFSRGYLPLWRLRDGQPPEQLPPWLWIMKESERHYWGAHEDPSLTPWVLAREKQRLVELGIMSLPILAEALPMLIRASEGGIRQVAAGMYEQRRALKLRDDGGPVNTFLLDLLRASAEV